MTQLKDPGSDSGDNEDVSFFEILLARLTDDKTIRWLLGLGILLILVGLGAFVALNWDTIERNACLKFLLALVPTLACGGLGVTSSRRPEMARTSGAFNFLALLATPLDLYLIGNRDLGLVWSRLGILPVGALLALASFPLLWITVQRCTRAVLGVDCRALSVAYFGAGLLLVVQGTLPTLDAARIIVFLITFAMVAEGLRRTHVTHLWDHQAIDAYPFQLLLLVFVLGIHLIVVSPSSNFCGFAVFLTTILPVQGASILHRVACRRSHQERASIIGLAGFLLGFIGLSLAHGTHWTGNLWLAATLVLATLFYGANWIVHRRGVYFHLGLGSAIFLVLQIGTVHPTVEQGLRFLNGILFGHGAPILLIPLIVVSILLELLVPAASQRPLSQVEQPDRTSDGLDSMSPEQADPDRADLVRPDLESGGSDGTGSGMPDLEDLGPQSRESTAVTSLELRLVSALPPVPVRAIAGLAFAASVACLLMTTGDRRMSLPMWALWSVLYALASFRHLQKDLLVLANFTSVATLGMAAALVLEDPNWIPVLLPFLGLIPLALEVRIPESIRSRMSSFTNYERAIPLSPGWITAGTAFVASLSLSLLQGPGIENLQIVAPFFSGMALLLMGMAKESSLIVLVGGVGHLLGCVNSVYAVSSGSGLPAGAFMPLIVAGIYIISDRSLQSGMGFKLNLGEALSIPPIPALGQLMLFVAIVESWLAPGGSIALSVGTTLVGIWSLHVSRTRLSLFPTILAAQSALIHAAILIIGPGAGWMIGRVTILLLTAVGLRWGAWLRENLADTGPVPTRNPLLEVALVQVLFLWLGPARWAWDLNLLLTLGVLIAQGFDGDRRSLLKVATVLGPAGFGLGLAMGPFPTALGSLSLFTLLFVASTHVVIRWGVTEGLEEAGYVISVMASVLALYRGVTGIHGASEVLTPLSFAVTYFWFSRRSSQPGFTIGAIENALIAVFLISSPLPIGFRILLCAALNLSLFAIDRTSMLDGAIPGQVSLKGLSVFPLHDLAWFNALLFAASCPLFFRANVADAGLLAALALTGVAGLGKRPYPVVAWVSVFLGHAAFLTLATALSTSSSGPALLFSVMGLSAAGVGWCSRGRLHDSLMEAPLQVSSLVLGVMSLGTVMAGWINGPVVARDFLGLPIVATAADLLVIAVNLVTSLYWHWQGVRSSTSWVPFGLLVLVHQFVLSALPLAAQPVGFAIVALLLRGAALRRGPRSEGGLSWVDGIYGLGIWSVPTLSVLFLVQLLFNSPIPPMGWALAFAVLLAGHSLAQRLGPDQNLPTGVLFESVLLLLDGVGLFWCLTAPYDLGLRGRLFLIAAGSVALRIWLERSRARSLADSGATSGNAFSLVLDRGAGLIAWCLALSVPLGVTAASLASSLGAMLIFFSLRSRRDQRAWGIGSMVSGVGVICLTDLLMFLPVSGVTSTGQTAVRPWDVIHHLDPTTRPFVFLAFTLHGLVALLLSDQWIRIVPRWFRSCRRFAAVASRDLQLLISLVAVTAGADLVLIRRYYMGPVLSPSFVVTCLVTVALISAHLFRRRVCAPGRGVLEVVNLVYLLLAFEKVLVGGVLRLGGALSNRVLLIFVFNWLIAQFLTVRSLAHPKVTRVLSPPSRCLVQRFLEIATLGLGWCLLPAYLTSSGSLCLVGLLVAILGCISAVRGLGTNAARLHLALGVVATHVGIWSLLEGRLSPAESLNWPLWAFTEIGFAWLFSFVRVKVPARFLAGIGEEEWTGLTQAFDHASLLLGWWAMAHLLWIDPRLSISSHACWFLFAAVACRRSPVRHSEIFLGYVTFSLAIRALPHLASFEVPGRFLLFFSFICLGLSNAWRLSSRWVIDPVRQGIRERISGIFSILAAVATLGFVLPGARDLGPVTLRVSWALLIQVVHLWITAGQKVRGRRFWQILTALELGLMPFVVVRELLLGRGILDVWTHVTAAILVFIVVCPLMKMLELRIPASGPLARVWTPSPFGSVANFLRGLAAGLAVHPFLRLALLGGVSPAQTLAATGALWILIYQGPGRALAELVLVASQWSSIHTLSSMGLFPALHPVGDGVVPGPGLLFMVLAGYAVMGRVLNGRERDRVLEVEGDSSSIPIEFWASRFPTDVLRGAHAIWKNLLGLGVIAALLHYLEPGTASPGGSDVLVACALISYALGFGVGTSPRRQPASIPWLNISVFLGLVGFHLELHAGLRAHGFLDWMTGTLLPSFLEFGIVVAFAAARKRELSQPGAMPYPVQVLEGWRDGWSSLTAILVIVQATVSLDARALPMMTGFVILGLLRYISGSRIQDHAIRLQLLLFVRAALYHGWFLPLAWAHNPVFTPGITFLVGIGYLIIQIMTLGSRYKRQSAGSDPGSGESADAVDQQEDRFAPVSGFLLALMPFTSLLGAMDSLGTPESILDPFLLAVFLLPSLHRSGRDGSSGVLGKIRVALQSWILVLGALAATRGIVSLVFWTQNPPKLLHIVVYSTIVSALGILLSRGAGWTSLAAHDESVDPAPGRPFLWLFDRAVVAQFSFVMMGTGAFGTLAALGGAVDPHPSCGLALGLSVLIQIMVLGETKKPPFDATAVIMVTVTGLWGLTFFVGLAPLLTSSTLCLYWILCSWLVSRLPSVPGLFSPSLRSRLVYSFHVLALGSSLGGLAPLLEGVFPATSQVLRASLCLGLLAIRMGQKSLGSLGLLLAVLGLDLIFIDVFSYRDSNGWPQFLCFESPGLAAMNMVFALLLSRLSKSGREDPSGVFLDSMPELGQICLGLTYLAGVSTLWINAGWNDESIHLLYSLAIGVVFLPAPYVMPGIVAEHAAPLVLTSTIVWHAIPRIVDFVRTDGLVALRDIDLFFLMLGAFWYGVSRISERYCEIPIYPTALAARRMARLSFSVTAVLGVVLGGLLSAAHLVPTPSMTFFLSALVLACGSWLGHRLARQREGGFLAGVNLVQTCLCMLAIAIKIAGILHLWYGPLSSWVLPLIMFGIASGLDRLHRNPVGEFLGVGVLRRGSAVLQGSGLALGMIYPLLNTVGTFGLMTSCALAAGIVLIGSWGTVGTPGRWAWLGLVYASILGGVAHLAGTAFGADLLDSLIFTPTAALVALGMVTAIDRTPRSLGPWLGRRVDRVILRRISYGLELMACWMSLAPILIVGRAGPFTVLRLGLAFLVMACLQMRTPRPGWRHVMVLDLALAGFHLGLLALGVNGDLGLHDLASMAFSSIVAALFLEMMAARILPRLGDAGLTQATLKLASLFALFAAPFALLSVMVDSTPWPADAFAKMTAAASLLLLGLYGFWKGWRHDSEIFVWGGEFALGGFFAYLRITGMKQASGWTSVVATILGVMLFHLASWMGAKKAGAFRRPLRYSGLVLPVAGVVLSWISSQPGQDSRTIVLLLFSGAFYTTVSLDASWNNLKYLAALMYNLALFMTWHRLSPGDPQGYLTCIGITLLWIVQTNRDFFSARVQTHLRLLSTVLVTLGPAMDFFKTGTSLAALFELGFISALIAGAGVLFRIRVLLYYGTAVLCLTLGRFLLDQGLAHHELGILLLVLIGAGVFGLAATLERQQAAIRRRIKDLRAALADWD